MDLILKEVDKVVGREIYLQDINLHLKSGSRNVILGRTLAGKTTLLRIMAGLDRPSRGRVLVGEKDVTGIPVRRRQVAMVYQQFINYPSLTVFKNIASPLKLMGLKRDEINRRVNQTAAMLHIEDLLDRLPADLSGGQQQRVAIARALVKETDLLLMDEPLVNLDYKLREELRVELKEVFVKGRAIVVYTTTEPTEALMMGGNIIVMDEGRILQAGPTLDVYRHPATIRVAEVFSDPPINLFNGTIVDRTIRIGRHMIIPQQGHLRGLSDGEYTLGVRSNHLYLKRNNKDDIQIPAKVELTEINGSETFIHARYDSFPLVVQERGVRHVAIGSDITVYVNPTGFFAYDSGGVLATSPPQTVS